MVKPDLLFKYGFLNKAGASQFGHLSVEERTKLLREVQIDPSKFADMDKQERASSVLNDGRTEAELSTYTGYPNSLRKFRLIYENFNVNLEEMYYWMLTQLSVDQQFPRDNIIKVTDVFSASEMSTYWGVSAQRLAIQQDRASQYLKFIADMVKTMFQLIRDLNIVDEKLSYYEDSFSDHLDKAADAEIVLKGQFADLVEGGPKNPQSIFGMAQQFNFVTLPNLFFQTNIPGKTLDEIKQNIRPFIQKLSVGNPTLKDVLERKLSQYYTWKYRTYDQLKTYRNLYKSYLKQHYNSIRLYMQWVKPYLRNIRRLSTSPEKTNSADLVAAFEGQMIEVEILAHKPIKGNYSAVLMLNFDYRSVPHMEWVPGSQERRSVMTGRAELNMKAYSWSKKEIDAYVQMKEEEDFELLKEIDGSIKEALDAVQDDIKRYLQDETPKKEEVEGPSWKIHKGKIIKITPATKKKSQPARSSGGVLEPFIGVFKAVDDLLRPLFPMTLIPQGRKTSQDGKKDAEKVAKLSCWLTYKFYKKAHRHLAW